MCNCDELLNIVAIAHETINQINAMRRVFHVWEHISFLSLLMWMKYVISKVKEQKY